MQCCVNSIRVAIVTLLLHCRYTVVTPLLPRCYSVVTLLLHTLLLHCCDTVVTLLQSCVNGLRIAIQVVHHTYKYYNYYYYNYYYSETIVEVF
jgi:hypothetical protein